MVHTYKIIGSLESLLSYLKDAETGVRGYFVVNDPVSGTIQQQFKRMDSVFSDVRVLTVSSTGQQKSLDTLNRLNSAKAWIL